MYSLAATRAELAEALHGRIRSHHRFLIGQHLKTVEQLEETIAAFDARIEAALEPFRDAIERLKEVPGRAGPAAQILIAEIGTDMPVKAADVWRRRAAGRSVQGNTDTLGAEIARRALPAPNGQQPHS